jgi:hypothetical protein
MGEVVKLLCDLHAATDAAQKAADRYIDRLSGVVLTLRTKRKSLRPPKEEDAGADLNLKVG